MVTVILYIDFGLTAGNVVRFVKVVVRFII